MTAAEAHVETNWQRSQAEAAACAAGDCVFASAKCLPAWTRTELRNPLRCECHHGCMGVRGTKYIEHGRPLMRYRFCPRRVRWCAEARARVRALKAGGPVKASPPSWQ